MTDSPEQLQSGLFGRGRLLDLGHAVEDEAHVAEDEHERKDEPEDQKRVRLIVLVRTAELVTLVEPHEDVNTVEGPASEEGGD